ncbi:MAG: hydroxyacid dehydrogenase [Phycisphaerae bacterium]|nr:hydroxyacid dehydrogenase [Phycisphaerae bacterium]
MDCIYDQLRGTPTILFAELEPWEQDHVSALCPKHCKIIASPQRLQAIGEDQANAEVTLFSPFIHSLVNAEQLARMPNLRLIATRSTGFDHIEIEACNRRGILVANVPHYGEDTVAEHAFGMILALTRKIHRCYERTSRGDFSIEGLRGSDLAGKTFGCLGVGAIGARALRIAGGFGMNRIAHDRRGDALLSGSLGFRYVTLEGLLAEADVLSLHVPLTDETRHIINRDTLARMKKGAILVNTARGALVDTAALIDALKSGHLAGAALDVLEAETAITEEAELLSSRYDLDTLRQVIRSNALLRMPNVIITPHNAFNSQEACQRIIETTFENIHAYLLGEPKNIVNK